MDKYEVIVVGGGHAGIEAALAAARLGVKTALVTISELGIGRLSCNPAVGGLAKSHIVSELDALGGFMAENADYCGIHYRTLNTRKGPAVQATRIQCDKLLYPQRAQSAISLQNNLQVIEGLVCKLIVRNGTVYGVELDDGSEIISKTTILAPGTFLSGRIYIGDWHQDAGRIGDIASLRLNEDLKHYGFRMARLKTGTPPRIHKDSLDYGQMQRQDGDLPPPLFSHSAKTWLKQRQNGQEAVNPDPMFHVEQIDGMRNIGPLKSQLPCFLTKTCEETHDIIERNLSRSALYGGIIAATGVRYCPSIEDKIVKFPHHGSHNVFIEPEGRGNPRIYPNGTSNSLPEDVQLDMIHTIPGMRRAEFIRPGYAIEYDFADPTQLRHTLESNILENLYLAGQVNGTTGYEEAAGQGFVAGINAAYKIMAEKPFIIKRSEAYIGVLIDDLVIKGTDEPYRMFTSRAEFRLTLRQDNACIRMHDHARRLGLLPKSILNAIDVFRSDLDTELARLERERYRGDRLAKILRRPENRYADLPSRNDALAADLIRMVETEVKYAGYIRREERNIEKMATLDDVVIPGSIDYDELPSLRLESREKLKRILPETLGEAARISGVNPSDVAIISVFIKRLGI